MPTTTPSKEIRVPTPEDYPWLMEELKRNNEVYDTKYSLLTPDRAKCYEMIKEMGANHLLLVIPATRSYIGGVLSAHILNPAITVLHHMLWWVPPEHRGGSSASRLLDAFIWYGKKRANWISLSLQKESGPSERSLRRKGFTLRDHVYLLEV